MEFEALQRAVETLHDSISNVPIGTLHPCNLKSLGEKITDTRRYLKHLNARSLAIKAEIDSGTVATVSTEEDFVKTLNELEEITAKTLLTEKSVKLCLHSYLLETKLSLNKDKLGIYRKIQQHIQRMFVLNDTMIQLQLSMETYYKKQLDLKLHCQNSISNYQQFIEEQQRLQTKRLHEMNPEIALTKEKVYGTLKKINLMKRLITNFVATSMSAVAEKPALADMFEKHRELISLETIMRIVPNAPVEPGRNDAASLDDGCSASNLKMVLNDVGDL